MLRVIDIRPVFVGIGMSMVPRDVEPGLYVPKREYDELKEMYENLLYASQRLAESRRTRPDRESENVSGVRAEV